MSASSFQGLDLRCRARRAILPVLCAVVGTLAWAVSPAQATTTIFEFTGAEQTFRVPGGVHSIHVVAIGGSGGASELLVPGGAAAQVTGDISVTPGNTVYVEVGGRGQDGASGGAGGFNGGATGGGGGGGASDIRTSPLEDGLSPDDRLIVAAGGGGGGGSGPSGMGGNGGAAGSAGGSSEGYGGGGAGTETEGGLGAAGCESSGQGLNGQRGLGGAGGDSEIESDPGGGGGGGYFGGGGGGGACLIGSSGGGGGSSLVPIAGSLVLASGSAAPEVQLTYTLVPPTISIVSPANGATYTRDQVVTANYSCTPPEGTTVEFCDGTVANGAALDTSTLGPHTFTVEGEDKDGAEGEKSVSYTVVPPSTSAGGSTSTGSSSSPPLPDTSLDGHPKETIKTKKKKVKVKFSFSSNVAGASFQCKVDKGKLESCASPKIYTVKRGSHVFSVQAVSAGGTDPIPATFRFKVKKKR